MSPAMLDNLEVHSVNESAVAALHVILAHPPLDPFAVVLLAVSHSYK